MRLPLLVHSIVAIGMALGVYVLVLLDDLPIGFALLCAVVLPVTFTVSTAFDRHQHEGCLAYMVAAAVVSLAAYWACVEANLAAQYYATGILILGICAVGATCFSLLPLSLRRDAVVTSVRRSVCAVVEGIAIVSGIITMTP